MLTRNPVAARAACAALFALVAGCGGGGDSSPAPTPPAPAPAAAPTAITTQPQAQSALTGATATFSVAATGDNLTYQWRRNGTPIAGATAASYTTPAVGHTDHAAQYTVVVSGAGGNVTSNAAALTLTPSADQQVFERSLLAAGDATYRVRWNLAFNGAQTPDTNYAYSERTTLTASPLTAGPQVALQTVPHNLTTSLPLSATALANVRVARVLRNGAILVVPTIEERRRFTYVGSSIRVESLAADQTTVGYASVLSGYTEVPLSGAVSATPPEMAQWFNSFFSNADVLTLGGNYAAGAAYTKFTATNEGDRYDVADCGGTPTVGATPNPCYQNTVLTAALTTGIASASDGRTYTLGDGELRTVGGVSVWVANVQRPVSATLSSTVQYRTYFQLNGHVYTGTLIRDGAVLGGTYFVSNPGAAAIEDRLTFFPYQIRLNKAAHDSLAAAIGL